MKTANKKNKNGKSKSWTVVVVGDLGKMTSFRLSKGVFFSAIGFVFTICAMVIISVVLYHGARTQNIALKDDLKRVETALLVANDEKEGAEVRLMVLADKGQKSPSKQKKPRTAVPPEKPKKIVKKAVENPTPKSQSKPASKKTPDRTPHVTQIARNVSNTDGEQKKPLFQTSQAADKKKEEPNEVTKPVSAVETKENRSNANDTGKQEAPTPSKKKLLTAALASPGSVTTDSLVVENLELRAKADQVSVKYQFNLKNVDAKGRKISGYTFVVLKPLEGSEEGPRGAPWTPIKDGKPTIFKRGQFFSISRFKFVRGTIPQIQDVKRFESATVYVYTDAGELVLEKVFPIDAVLKT